jgi:histidine triad (HIT) family protein
MADCIFCSIVAGSIPADKVYEDENLIGFKDLYPKAPVHLLVIPKKHIENLFDLTPDDRHIMTELMYKLPEIARQQGLQQGFRTIINTGPAGGQEVYHLHAHILAGQKSLPGF